MESGLEGGEAVSAQHVKKSGLASIVQTQEQNLGALVSQAYSLV